MPGITHVLEIDDEGFIFDRDTGHTYNVNTSGLLVISELISGTPLHKIVELLCQKYGVSKKIATSDLDDLMRQLLRLELVESVEVPVLD